MTTPLKLLLLEDQSDDEELVLLELEKDGFQVQHIRVDNEVDFRAQLAPDYDIILADFSMPQFNAIQALQILGEKPYEVPLIVVSGSISEEVAVECMRLGAADYLLKDRLSRLGSSIRNVIENRLIKEANRQAQRDLLIKNWAVASSISAVAIFNLNGDITYVNDAFLKVWAYDNPSQIIGKSFHVLWQSNSEAEQVLHHLTQNGSWRGEMTAHKHNETSMYMEVSTSVVLNEYNQPVCLMGTFLDITDRKQAELALRESELRFRQIAENIYEVVFLADLTNGGTLYVNPAFERIWGYPLLKAYQTGANITEDTIHPDDLNRIQQSWEVQDKHHSPFDETYRIIRSNGEPRWVRDRSWLIFDTNDKPYRRVSIIEDVTEQHTAEQLRREAERLAIELQNEKELREIKSRLISTVSHDFRNPLSAIQLSIETMLKYSHRLDDARRKEKLEMMQEQVNRMNELMEDVLTIGQLDSESSIFQPVHDNLETFAHALIVEFATFYTRTHVLTYSKQGEDFNFWFDRSLMRRVIENLIGNAVKYSPSQTTIHFEIKQHDDSIIIRVSDEGIGIPHEDQEKVFEMFGRGSNVDTIKGTGLGLPIVKQAVELHGGSISVQNRVGGGSTFTIIFPLPEEEETQPLTDETSDDEYAMTD